MNFQEDCVFNMLYYNHIQDYRICLQSVYHVYRIKNDFNPKRFIIKGNL